MDCAITHSRLHLPLDLQAPCDHMLDCTSTCGHSLLPLLQHFISTCGHSLIPLLQQLVWAADRTPPTPAAALQVPCPQVGNVIVRIIDGSAASLYLKLVLLNAGPIRGVGVASAGSQVCCRSALQTL